jgi:hypothetical protein
MRRIKSFVSCSTLGAAILLLSTPFYVSAAALEMNGNVAVTGIMSATSFTGSGAGLTNIPGSSIAGTSITVNQLADGAVTPVKIGFLGKVAIVATNGGDYDNPATAMGSYADWCGTPSETNRCLLKIMPGVYDVGTTSVVMQPYIDIEGSGENTTIIQGNLDSSTSGIVNGASNAEIRFLTIKHTGGGANAMGIYLSSASPKISNVSINVSNPGNTTYGIYGYPNTDPVIRNVGVIVSGNYNFGIALHTCTIPLLSDVYINVSGVTNIGFYSNTCAPSLANVISLTSGGTINYATRIIDSSPVFTNLYASATGGSTGNYGVHTGGAGTVNIHHSVIVGATSTIFNQNTTAVRVGASQLNGGDVTVGSGSVTCVGAYNGSFAALISSCSM